MRRSAGSMADPRRPEAIVKYHPPKIDPEDADPDYYCFLGMILSRWYDGRSISGKLLATRWLLLLAANAALRLSLQDKWTSWAGLFCCILGLMNEKTSSRDMGMGMQAFTCLLQHCCLYPPY
ncbi:hypothetical protein SYNPS1DRAFT_28106 [Syncephalis pseudoplumigaleata]|uniref:Protein Asterix n=1 Tax=Syncephalis pseudoplumigaleata TaxID=1712513 RepID=A0A4V1J1T6_9FUNG|nr:hypothetical protein SYNPS1DRAFT_28106 [Syncephalis pseudoplumigaleata]|eukprot:RKP26189.1 hypothetical protein SYNPS1DRAFT_28106 [Syncephalis pseudoplumigaleata]